MGELPGVAPPGRGENVDSIYDIVVLLDGGVGPAEGGRSSFPEYLAPEMRATSSFPSASFPSDRRDGHDVFCDAPQGSCVRRRRRQEKPAKPAAAMPTKRIEVGSGMAPIVPEVRNAKSVPTS